MSDLEKAARMALEALKQIDEAMPFPVAKFAQAALRQALKQPQDEWLTGCPKCGMDGECLLCDGHGETVEKAARMALEALENWREFDPENWGDTDNKAVTALRQALSDSVEQPASKPWVGLTDKQIDRAIAELGLNYLADVANNRAVLRELCRKAANAKEEA